MECTIVRSDKGPYYTLYVNDRFQGNYDTVTEAAGEYEQMKRTSTDEEEKTA